MSMKQLGKHNSDGSLKQPTDYSDGRTKQAFRDECDIQKIMARAEKAGTISHLQKFEGVYADYSDVDFHALENQLARGRSIFEELPAEIRQEFGQSPQAFCQYVNNPANKEDLLKKLPGLAAPGRQFHNQSRQATADELAAEAAASEPASETSPEPKPEAPPSPTPAPPPAEG